MSHTTRSRRLHGLVGLVALAALVAAGAALAEGPAVDRVNGSVFGGYGYGEAASASVSAGGPTTFLPGSERQGPFAGATFTFPIGERLGGRVIGAGELISVEQPPEGAFPGSDASGWGAAAGVDLFVRDPEVGFFSLGYRFGIGDPAEDGADDLLSNGLSLGAGYFIPDQDLGEIDWSIEVDYARQSLEGTGFSDDVHALSGSASSGWYWTDDFRFTASFLWALDLPDAGSNVRDLRGGADVAWLLPFFGDLRYVTAFASGNAGRERSDFAPPLEDADRTVWAVGGGLSFIFPGAESLLQLTRARQ